jgi:hypothetical protein
LGSEQAVCESLPLPNDTAQHFNTQGP